MVEVEGTYDTSGQMDLWRAFAAMLNIPVCLEHEFYVKEV